MYQQQRKKEKLFRRKSTKNKKNKARKLISIGLRGENLRVAGITEIQDRAKPIRTIGLQVEI
jgi:hypothetical protein